MIESTEIPTIVSPRVQLVNGIVDRAEKYRLILVRGTPACGKTTLMNLLANELLARHSGETPVHIITGWDEKQVEKAGGWNNYLMQETGIEGRAWPTSPAYLLLDEAQESYWDTTLWSAFFKAIIPFNAAESPCVMLFASYGSPGRGNSGFYEQKYFKTPMDFGPSQLISMRAEESFDEEAMDCDDQNGLGLLLDAEEATDVVKKYIDAVGPPSLSKDLMDELFLISNGHVGCLTALMGVLGRAAVSVLRSLQSSSNICLKTDINPSHIGTGTSETSRSPV